MQEPGMGENLTCLVTARSLCPTFVAGTLTIVCDLCFRRGHYSVALLMAEYGDAQLTELLPVLASCPEARTTNIYDRCRAVYKGLEASC
jgi:hypothetical protein